MAKLNTDTSIVDYLKSTGNDSSYSARADLAQSMGISNYTGTASQNTQMLNALKNQQASQASTPAPAPASSGGSSGGGGGGGGGSALSGVDGATYAKMNSSYSMSDTVSNAQKEANKYLDKVKEYGNITDIIGQETWDAINKQFASSEAYNEAMKYTQDLLAQLSSGKTSYTDQIKNLMSEIQNREDFVYDVDSDVLFQQALGSAMNSGKQAMQDTIGQASALTGGYGSTYATSAGNQAYNAFIEDAYDNLPQYYQMALEAYQMEGEDMYRELAMLGDADAKEYQRTYDAWNANFANAQHMYDKEYTQWRDSVNNAYNSASLQLQEHGQLFDYAYNTYNAVQNNASTLYQQEYQRWADEVNNAFKLAGMLNSDYWQGMNFNESVRQFDTGLAFDNYKFNAEMDYKYDALAQDQAQFNANYALKSKSGGGSGGSGDSKYQFSDSQLKQLQSAYNNAGGGMDGENAVLDRLESWDMFPDTDLKMSVVDNIVNGFVPEEQPVAWYQDTNWTKTGEGKGFLGKNNDAEDTYELNGTAYTFDQIERMLEGEKDLTEFEKVQFLNSLKALQMKGG